MINYRIVRLTALHGLNAEEYFAKFRDNLTNNTYAEKLKCLFEGKILYSDSFSQSMCDLGQEAYEIVWDCESLQKTWAKEHGVPYSRNLWQFEILCAQIEFIRPEVVYFQGTEAAIPGRFSGDSRNSSLVTLLKERFTFIRLISMFSGFPTSVKRTVDVDILFSCTPTIQNHYKRLGIPSVVCYHAFDNSLLRFLRPTAEIYDFTFSGSTRAPESRYWILRELLDRTPISMWIDEPEEQTLNKMVSNDNVGIRRKIRWLVRKSVKFVFSLVGLRSLDIATRASWIPKVVRSVAMDVQSESNLSNRYNFELMVKAATDMSYQTLREIHPDRCWPPVAGLEYYENLRSSKISFNRHADATGDSVGNLRMFEVTGVGSCLLTDTGANIKELFEPGVEVVVYTSVDEAAEGVRYLLENEKERKKISEAGYRRTLRDHTFANRCQLIDEVIRSQL